MIKSNKVYYLSSLNKPSIKFTPHIPKNEFVDWGVEDGSTPRVCLGLSIDSCILAAGKFKPGQELFVYTATVNSSELVHPSKNQVPDVDITHEVWYMKDITVHNEGKIRLTNEIKHQYTLKFKKADGTEYIGYPRIYGYEVIEKRNKYANESLSQKIWTEKDINSIEDLIEFYNSSNYGTVLNGKRYVGDEVTGHIVDKSHILTVEEQLQYKIGNCYDTVTLSMYFLTKWNIEYKKYFICTKRSFNESDSSDPTHTFLIYKDVDSKPISFPESEIPIISKQSTIITTRVSADYLKYNVGDIVCTSWNKYYVISKRINISKIEDHPFYDKLTNRQISYLRKFNEIAVLTLSITRPRYVWKWLEGSWQPFKNNTLSDSNPELLVKNIAKELTNAAHMPCLLYEEYKWPKYGCNMRMFEATMKLGNFKYEIVPDSKYSQEAIITAAQKAIKDNVVYHATPHKHDIIEGKATGSYTNEVGNVFVTPFKGTAACFIISKADIIPTIEKQLGKHVRSCNLAYDVWNMPNDKLYTIPKLINVQMNIRGFKPFKGHSEGYLYYIDFDQYKDKCHMWDKNPETDVEFVIEGDVKPFKVEKITVDWLCSPSEEQIKIHGEGSVESLISLEHYPDKGIRIDSEKTNPRATHVYEKMGFRIEDDNPDDPNQYMLLYVSSSDETFTPFIHTDKYGIITKRAKPYYNPIGSNSWQHIQQVYTQATKFVKHVEKRDLSLVEYAAVLFHDSSVKSDPSKDHHAKKSAEIAKAALTDIFNEQEIQEVYTAILEHDKEDNPKWMFTTNISDILASADANPPDADWILNKSYAWGIKHGLNEEERIPNVLGSVVKFYGSTPEEGGMKWPQYYATYYAKQIIEMRKILNSLTYETCKARILAYRKRHRLAEGDIRLPEPSCEWLTDLINLGFVVSDVYKLSSGLSNQMKNPDAVKSALSSHKYWFIASSGKSPIGMIIPSPKQPKDPLVAANVKDGTAKRVCVYPTISQALSATHLNYTGKLAYIYAIHKNAMWGYKLAMPNSIVVPDSDYTGELWSNKELTLKYACTVRCTTPKNKIKIKCKTYDGKPYLFDLIDWNYEIVDGRSFENLEVSTESLPANIKEKRKKIEDYILSSMKLLDPHTDINQKYWKNKFASMNDQDFDKFMNYIKEKKCNIHMFVPPLKVHLKNAELIEAAHKLDVKLMHRIWMLDENTGLKYLTPEEYMVLQLPVRRQQQFLDEKISVPDNDKTVDGFTGQVTGDSMACAITNPEVHILQSRNLDASLYEFANVRGGNIHNYAEFKRSLEETGSVSLNQLDPNSRTRVSVMGGVLLSSMMIENNFNDM